jgi:hypothetical protein
MKTEVEQTTKYLNEWIDTVCPVCGPLADQESANISDPRVHHTGSMAPIPPPVHISFRCWPVRVVEGIEN